MQGKCFCKLICLLFIRILNGVNVALHKTGDYCGQTSAPKTLFDGDKFNVEHLTAKCPVIAFVRVHLISKYEINYVVVFGGKGNDRGQLDFFLVYRSEGSLKDLCSQYHGRATDSPTGMRVNCVLTKNFHSTIDIESLKNEGFDVAEIEVHTFGLPEERLLIYIGCFNAAHMVGQMDWTQCQNTCLNRGYAIFAVKGNKYCGCVYSLSNYLLTDSSNCNLKCSMGYKTCGGKAFYSFYLMKVPLPLHVGCSKSITNYTARGVATSEMSAGVCLNECSKSFHVLVGRLDDPENNILCLCGENASEIRVFSAIECGKNCTGNPEEICGANYASVYTGCYHNKEFFIYSSCSELFQCAGPHDMDRLCDGHCNPGYFGDYCLERDFDECIFNPCDDYSSTCVNFNGSFSCICHPGYVLLSNGECYGGIISEIYRHYFDYVVLLIIFSFFTSLVAVAVYNGAHRPIQRRILKKRRVVRKYIREKMAS